MKADHRFLGVLTWTVTLLAQGACPSSGPAGPKLLDAGTDAGCDQEGCPARPARGLVFEFPETSANSAPTVAVGGTMSVVVHDAETRQPLTYPFDAQVEPSVAEVVEQHDATLILRGTSPGSATLRILDRETGETLGETPISSGQPVSLEAHVLSWLVLPPDRQSNLRILRTGQARIWLLARSRTSRQVVDRGARILVDPASGGRAAALSWDTFELRPPRTGDATVVFEIGDTKLQTVLPVADRVDDATAVLMGGSLGEAGQCPSAPILLVFQAWSEGAPVAAGPVSVEVGGLMQARSLPGAPANDLDNVAFFSTGSGTGFASVRYTVGGIQGTWSCWHGSRLQPAPPLAAR